MVVRWRRSLRQGGREVCSRGVSVILSALGRSCSSIDLFDGIANDGGKHSAVTASHSNHKRNQAATGSARELQRKRL